MTEISSATPDLQASTPEVRLSLTRAGVTGVQKAVRVSHEGHQTVMAAEIECTVDLSQEQKGVHMSRFPELFEEAIESVVGTRRCTSSRSPSTSRQHIVGRQRASRGGAITARWPVRRTTPVSKLRRRRWSRWSGSRRRRPTGCAARRGRGDGDQRLPVRARPDSRAGRRAAGRGRLRGRRPDPRSRSPRDAQPARQGIALRRDRAPAGRQRPRHDRPGVDERADLRAA